MAIAFYNKTFTAYVPVTHQADHVGNQLAGQGDVKLRGIIVGQIRKTTTAGDGATVDLALEPDQVALIPANVQARILPKTLFGEKSSSISSSRPTPRHSTSPAVR